MPEHNMLFADCWTIVTEYLPSFHDLSSVMLVNSECLLGVSKIHKYWNTKIAKLKESELYSHPSLTSKGLHDSIQQLEKQQWDNRRQLLLGMIDKIREVLDVALDENCSTFLGNYDVEFIDRRKIPSLPEKLKTSPLTIKVSLSSSVLDRLLFLEEHDMSYVEYNDNSTFEIADSKIAVYFEREFTEKFHKKSNLVLIPFSSVPNLSELSGTIPRVLLLTCKRTSPQKVIWNKKGMRTNISPNLIELFSDEHFAQISKSFGALTFLEAAYDTTSVRNLLLEYIAKIYGYCLDNTVIITTTNRAPPRAIEVKQVDATPSQSTDIPVTKKQRKSKECIIS